MRAKSRARARRDPFTYYRQTEIQLTLRPPVHRDNSTNTRTIYPPQTRTLRQVRKAAATGSTPRAPPTWTPPGGRSPDSIRDSPGGSPTWFFLIFFLSKHTVMEHGGFRTRHARGTTEISRVVHTKGERSEPLKILIGLLTGHDRYGTEQSNGHTASVGSRYISRHDVKVRFKEHHCGT